MRLMPRDFFLHRVKYFTIFLTNFWEINATFLHVNQSRLFFKLLLIPKLCHHTECFHK